MQLTKHDALAEMIDTPGIHTIDDPGLEMEAAKIAESHAIRVYRIDSDCVSSKSSLLDTISEALSFPEYFGDNWDALEECLRDLPLDENRGWLLIFENADRLLTLRREELKMLLGVLSSAADFWKSESARFTVVLIGGTELARFVSDAQLS